MNQQLLDELIGAAPPSTIDLDGIVSRQRRRRRLRRLVSGGSAALAVLLLVGMAATLRGGRPPQEVPVAPVAVAPSPSAGKPAELTLDRLRTLLESAVAAHAPGVSWIYMPDVPGEPRLPDGHPNMWMDKDPVSYRARSGLAAGGRKGGFYLDLRPAGCADPTMGCSPLYECDGTVPICATTRTPSGLKLVRWVDKPGKGWHFYGVDVLLGDGERALRLQAVNYFGGDGSPVSAPQPLLTRAQLDRVATEIADELTRGA